MSENAVVTRDQDDFPPRLPLRQAVIRQLALVFVSFGIIGIALTLGSWVMLAPLAAILVGAYLSIRSWRTPFEWADRPLAEFRAPQYGSHGPIDLSEETVAATATLLRSPALYTKRIVHEVSPEDEYLTNSVTRYLRLPKSTIRTASKARREFYVPLLYPERGSLIDNLATHTSQGGAVPLLPSADARVLTYQALCFMTEALYADESRPVRSLVRLALIRLFDALARDASVVHDATALDSYKGLLALLAQQGDELEKDERWHAEHKHVLALWEAALSSYVIFGVVTARPEASISISVSYTQPALEAEQFKRDGQPAKFTAAQSRFAGLKDRIRFLLNIQPYVFRFPLQYERATASYHLRFNGERDHYVAFTKVLRKGGRSNDQSHFVVSRSANRNVLHYAHIYVRPLSESQAQGRLIVRIAVAERPPGLLGLSALVNVVQLVILTFVVFFYGSVFSGTGDNDFPALLVALPGLAAAWLANQIVPGRLRRIPLSAVGALAFSSGAAIVATVLAVLGMNDAEPLAIRVGETTLHTLWCALLVLSFIVTGNAIGRWWLRTASYVERSRRMPRLDRYAV
jgi:hypothetical protein